MRPAGSGSVLRSGVAHARSRLGRHGRERPATAPDYDPQRRAANDSKRATASGRSRRP